MCKSTASLQIYFHSFLTHNIIKKTSNTYIWESPRGLMHQLSLFGLDVEPWPLLWILSLLLWAVFCLCHVYLQFYMIVAGFLFAFVFVFSCFLLAHLWRVQKWILSQWAGKTSRRTNRDSIQAQGARRVWEFFKFRWCRQAGEMPNRDIWDVHIYH